MKNNKGETMRLLMAAIAAALVSTTAYASMATSASDGAYRKVPE